MDLSIVILHYGNVAGTTETLKALKRAWLPEKTEVFVVNNGREGANAEIPFDANLKFDLKYFEIPNRGYPQGNNFVLKQARGKFLCILTDVVVEKNTFKVLLDYLKSHKQVGVVAPRLVYENGDVQDNYRAFPNLSAQLLKRTALRRFFKRRMSRYLMWNKDPEVNEAVDWLTGAMQLFTRKCWDKIGPKDERYFLFMSDVDICRVAWKKNFEVHFVGDTQAKHEMARLSGGGVRDFFRKKVVRIHVVDAFKYYLKYWRKPLPKRSPSASLD